MSQVKYDHDLIYRSSMANSKPVLTLIPTKQTLNAHSYKDFHDPTLYQHLAGALQYLSLTRPDIPFTVNKLCQ